MEIKTYVPTNHKVRMLIYGGSGVGKTVFGATAPKPLFLAVENGLLSLADRNVQFVNIKSLQDMSDILAALKNGKLTGEDGKPLDYDTIVIDSLTEVQQVVIQNITGGRQPSMNQWGDFSDKMAVILKGFAGLDKHVIFTCLESEKNAEDDEGKEFTRFQPELFGKLAEKAQAMMDFVGRYYMKTIVVNDKPTASRVLTFSYNPKWKAKDRSGKMPQFVDPDFSKLMVEFAKVKIGEGTVVGSAPSAIAAVELKFAPDPKDHDCSKEQSAEIKEAWNHLMRICKDKAGKEIPEAKWDAYLGATMKMHCGVDTTTKLKAKQATSFFNHILSEMEKWEKKDAPDSATASSSEEAAEYSIEADLKRRDELGELARSALEDVADGHGIKVTSKMKRQEVTDAIMAVEMPNSPKKL